MVEFQQKNFIKKQLQEIKNTEKQEKEENKKEKQCKHLENG